MPQTHGEHYKYLGNYYELFELLKKYVPAYRVEAPKLFQLILFNYLFSNGDAHFKNFSLTQTELGDHKLSPAYDLLNSGMHIEDKDFVLEEGLLPPTLAKGNMHEQFYILGELARISTKIINSIFSLLKSKKEEVLRLATIPYLSDKMKRNYEQAYLVRFKKLNRD